MTDAPDNWYRPTPALAGRLQARGIPPPVFYIAMGVALLFGTAYRATFAGWLGNGLGWFAAFGVGATLGVCICMAVRPLSRKDRDWFAIMADWWRIQFRLLALKIWERFYKW